MSIIKRLVLIIYILGLSSMNPSFGQINGCNLPFILGQQENPMNLRTFDIKEFNEKSYGGRRFFTLENDVTVRHWKNNDGYMEEIGKLGSPYECVYIYNSKGHLTMRVNSFYTHSIGLLTRYDEQGNIIEQEDLDKDYPFSIAQLTEKMKRDFGFDISISGERRHVKRIIDEQRGNKPCYRIYNGYDFYLVDGTTGELLFKTKLKPSSNDDRIEQLRQKVLELQNAKRQP